MKTLTDQKSNTPSTTRAEVAKVEALAAVAEHVAGDSRREPERYLDETVVPCGGE